MPQAHFTFGAAYILKYDKVIKDIPLKVKIVDDVLLFDLSVEAAFNPTFGYLSCCT